MAAQIDAKRFATPTDALRLEELLRRQRGVLYRALAGGYCSVGHTRNLPSY